MVAFVQELREDFGRILHVQLLSSIVIIRFFLGLCWLFFFGAPTPARLASIITYSMATAMGQRLQVFACLILRESIAIFQRATLIFKPPLLLQRLRMMILS